MKLVHLAPLLVIALAPSIPRPIGACSLAPRDGGGWYEEPILGDSTPPRVLNASYSVYRPMSEDHSDAGCMASCGPGPGYVMLTLFASDDLTPTERIGFRFAVVEGQVPRQFQYDQVLLIDPYSPNGNELGLMFDRDSGPFSFTLEVTAIDQNGNESEPIQMEIVD